MLYFCYKFPEENLVDKCLGFQLYIEENGEDLSYSQLHISISEAQKVFKNCLITDRFQGEIYKSKCCTTKNKTIKKRLRINVTKQIKRFTKYQGKSLTIRKLLQKSFCQVNKSEEINKTPVGCTVELIKRPFQNFSKLIFFSA